MNRLNEKTVLVTGGAHGIGKAACRRMAEQGARVAVTDTDERAGRDTADQINDAGHEAAFWPLDLTDEQAVESVIAAVVDRWGRLDVLVNNAGISGTNHPTDQIDADDWDRVIAVNVKGVFLCTKHAVPRLRDAGGGSIVNLSSIYGKVGAPDLPAYHASKGAVTLMTKTDALLYATDGIRVNSVHPGFIWTPLVEQLAEDSEQSVEDFRAALDERHPIGHVGEPDDVAHGIVYLASDEAKFLTGSELVIDGGYTAQ